MCCSFPKDPKITTVEKTNDPGPASYAKFDTVGVMPKYLRNDANARVVPDPKKKSDE